MNSLNFVVGFLFNKAGSRVAMVQKNRPAWQAGKLNGCGGLIKDGESAGAAMVRECQEEMGAKTRVGDWRLVAVQQFPIGSCHYFSLFDDGAFQQAKTLTDEPVIYVHTDTLAGRNLVANANYLIPLCLHADAAFSGSRLVLPIHLVERSAVVKESAQPCGCDPGANWKCELHR